MTNSSRKIEIFSAGCSVCQDVIKQIEDESCPSCDIRVLEMSELEVQERARELGIKSIPSVVIDGELADCCAGRGVNLDALRAAGLGQPMA